MTYTSKLGKILDKLISARNLEVKTFDIPARAWSPGGNWITSSGYAPSFEGYRILDVMNAWCENQSKVIPVIFYNNAAGELRGYVTNFLSSSTTQVIHVNLLCAKE